MKLPREKINGSRRCTASWLAHATRIEFLLAICADFDSSGSFTALAARVRLRTHIELRGALCMILLRGLKCVRLRCLQRVSVVIFYRTRVYTIDIGHCHPRKNNTTVEL